MRIISTRQTSTPNDPPSQRSIKLFTQNGCTQVHGGLMVILLARQYSSVKLGYSKWGSWGRGLSLVSEMGRPKASLQRLLTLTPHTPLSQVLPMAAFHSFILFISFAYRDDTITREVLPWQPTLCRRYLDPQWAVYLTSKQQPWSLWCWLPRTLHPMVYKPSFLLFKPLICNHSVPLTKWLKQNPIPLTIH